MTTPGELRSRIMRSVGSKNTKPELVMRRLLHRNGYRFRLHRKDLPGSPDLTFPGRRKVIFIHGCFWHGHDCPRGARLPKTNQAYWEMKISRNRTRDKRTENALASMGWRMLVVWECKLRDTIAALADAKFFLDN